MYEKRTAGIKFLILRLMVKNTVNENNTKLFSAPLDSHLEPPAKNHCS